MEDGSGDNVGGTWAAFVDCGFDYLNTSSFLELLYYGMLVHLVC